MVSLIIKIKRVDVKCAYALSSEAPTPSKPSWLSSLFKGMTFVLTQGAHPVQEAKDLNTSMTSALESETEHEADGDAAEGRSSSQFVRSVLAKTITDNGGKKF